MPPAPLLQQMEEPVHFSRVCLKKYTHTYIYILTAFALIVLVRVVDLENTRRKSHEDAGCSWEAAWPQRPPSQTPRPAQSSLLRTAHCSSQSCTNNQNAFQKELWTNGTGWVGMETSWALKHNRGGHSALLKSSVIKDITLE